MAYFFSVKKSDKLRLGLVLLVACALLLQGTWTHVHLLTQKHFYADHFKNSLVHLDSDHHDHGVAFDEHDNGDHDDNCDHHHSDSPHAPHSAADHVVVTTTTPQKVAVEIPELDFFVAFLIPHIPESRDEKIVVRDTPLRPPLSPCPTAGPSRAPPLA